MSLQHTTEVVVPYASRNGLNHLRVSGDYRTNCGRECEGWSVVEDISLSELIDSPYFCKKCKANL